MDAIFKIHKTDMKCEARRCTMLQAYLCQDDDVYVKGLCTVHAATWAHERWLMIGPSRAGRNEHERGLLTNILRQCIVWLQNADRLEDAGAILGALANRIGDYEDIDDDNADEGCTRAARALAALVLGDGGAA